MSNEIHSHSHSHINETLSQEQRVKRFSTSAVLRVASAAIEAWGAISSNQPALLIESAEEITDAMTFGAAAVEAGSNKKGLVSKARKWAIGFAITASTLATGDFVSEMVSDKFTFLKPSEGLDFSHNDIKAAASAVALNGLVLFINRKGKESNKTSDKYAYRDSLRDFVIPISILGIAALKAPHLVEYGFEAGGISYGWYNTKQLYNGWKPKKN